MTHTRYAFVKARWHADIVDRAYDGFAESIPASQIDVVDVPGAFEMPLMAQTLAKSGKYDAIICAAFVVDGGIYRHDFVATAVVDARGAGYGCARAIRIADAASLSGNRPSQCDLSRAFRRKGPRGSFGGAWHRGSAAIARRLIPLYCAGLSVRPAAPRCWQCPEHPALWPRCVRRSSPRPHTYRQGLPDR